MKSTGMKNTAMKRLADILVRPRSLPVAVVFLAIAIVTPADDSAPWWVSGGAWLVVAIAIVAVALNLAGHDPDSTSLSQGMASDPAARSLLRRWLRRSRYYRFVGGAVGLVAGVALADVFGAGWLIVAGLAGVAFGGALAEIHVLRRHRRGPRIAGLESRRLDDYVGSFDLNTQAAVACLTVLVAVGSVVMQAATSTATWCALASVAIAAAVIVLQRMVALRSRPALDPDLRAADDLLRRLAATRGFARPATALVLALLAKATHQLGTGEQFRIASAVLWLAALVWFAVNRRLGSDTRLRREAALTP